MFVVDLSLLQESYRHDEENYRVILINVESSPLKDDWITICR